MEQMPTNRIIEIFMKRDNLTQSEAMLQYEQMKQDFNEIMENSTDNPFQAIIEVETMLMEDYGLEMDYIDDMFY